MALRGRGPKVVTAAAITPDNAWALQGKLIIWTNSVSGAQDSARVEEVMAVEQNRAGRAYLVFRSGSGVRNVYFDAIAGTGRATTT